MRHIIFLLIISVVVSCNTNNDSGVEKRRKHANAIKTELMLGLPIEIVSYKDGLIINDFQTQKLLSYLNTNGGIINSFGYKGNGPGEFLPPVHTFVEGDVLYVYDRQKQVMYMGNVGNDSLSAMPMLSEIFSVNDSRYDIIHKLNDSLYIGSGFFESRFALLDNSGRTVGYVGEYPQYWSMENSLPKNVIAMYHSSRFQKKIKSNLFAVATSDILSVYKILPNDISLLTEKLLNDYSYEYVNDGRILSTNRSKSTKRGVIDMATDEYHIYLLFDNGSAATPTKENNEILVFDWQGSHEYTIIPNVNLSVITTMGSKKKIYGVSWEDGGSIWEISI